MEIILYLAAIFIVIIAQVKVNGAYSRYKKIRNLKGYNGATAARIILDHNGLNNVQVELSQNGTLTDHFDPTANVVRLSHDVYYDSSIASIAIAAHECGHAIQHAQHYPLIDFRNKILPTVMIANNLSWTVLFIGLIFSMSGLLYLGITCLIVIAIFQLVTLPIELDASKRALVQLSGSNLIYQDEGNDVKAMLDAAAFTYIAALINTILQIIRIFLIARNND